MHNNPCAAHHFASQPTLPENLFLFFNHHAYTCSAARQTLVKHLAPIVYSFKS